MTSDKNLVLKTCDLPAVPVIAVKIIKLIDNDNTTVDDIQKAIMADQSLATRVLKIANSAFYGVRHNVDTISQAISIMGFNAVKNLTLAASTREVYKKFGLLEQKLWEHSLGVSIAAGIIAMETSFLKREEAVVAGLLHDIGKVVMNNGHPEKFSLLTQRVYEEKVTYASIEQDIFGFSHAEAGYLVSVKWGFPHILSDVIRRHHSYIPGRPLHEDPYANSLSATIILADALCGRLGVGYRGPGGNLDDGIEGLRKMLDISKPRLDEIIAVFKNAYVEEKMNYQE